MKTKLFILLTYLFYVSIYGQTNHIITENADGVRNLDIADIDGDGDADVLSASIFDDTVAWFENDGQGTFIEHIITDLADVAYSVYPADIDGDGDMDVFYASRTFDKVAWRENTDGQGNFGPEQVITTNADSVIDVFSTDIDGDGDADVLSASRDDDTVAWYENMDGLGTSWIEHIITDQADWVFSVYPDDIDGDGDMDVLSSSRDDGKLAWHENIDGQGMVWEEHIIKINAESYEVYAGDFDGDGDVDVLAAINPTATLAWYENTDGQGAFIEHIIELDAGCGSSISVVDIDSDNDMDILTTELVKNNVCYYKNDGNAIFTKYYIIDGEADGPISARAADINNDGDMDVVSGWYNVDTVVWTEDFILGVDENTLLDFTVYPIPTTGILNVQSETTIVQIEVYNELGQLVVSNHSQSNIDISSVSEGIYFIKIKDENGAFGTQKVVKK